MNSKNIKKEAESLLKSGYTAKDATRYLWNKYAHEFSSRKEFDNVIGRFCRRFVVNKAIEHKYNDSCSNEKDSKIIQFPEDKATHRSMEVNMNEDGSADGIVKAPQGTFQTEEEILKEMDLSPDLFKITSLKKSRWEAQAKGGDIIQMEAFKVSCERKTEITPEESAAIIQESFDRTKRLVKFPYENIPAFSNNEKKNKMGVFQVCDCHFGAVCTKAEHGIQWGPRECEEDLNFITSLAIHQLKANPVDGLIIAMTGDGINSDTTTHTTTHGTQQFDGMLHYSELVRKYFFLMCDVIDRFEKELQVKINVLHTIGNHDEKTMFDLMMMLDIRYANDPNVVIFNELNTRKYRKYGNSLLTFSHGQSEGKRIKICPQNEAPVEWGQTKYTYIFTEHSHQYRMEPDGRTFIMTGSTIAPPGTWTKNSAYVGGRRGGQLAIFDKNLGLLNQCFLPVLHDNIDSFVVDCQEMF